MLTGFDGVRYGLVVPKKESKPAPKKGLSVFGDEDSEDEKAAVGRNIERQAQKKLSDQKVKALITFSSIYYITHHRVCFLKQ